MAFSAAVGTGVIAYVIFFIGLAGQLRGSVVIIVLLLMLLGSSRDALALAKKILRSFSDLPPLIVGMLVLVAVLPFFILTLYPPTAWDSISYHLASVKMYLASGKVSATPYLRYAVSPQLMAMLFSAVLLFFNDIAAHLVSFSLMLTTALLTYSFCARYCSQRSGIWAAALFLSNLSILWLGSVAYVDIGLVFFITAATYALVNWLVSKETGWLGISALMVGFALGVKYTALFFIGVFGVAVLYETIRVWKYRPLFLFASLALLSGAPWYAFIYYHTSNPVWPFYPELFGYTVWDAQDVKGQMHDLLNAYGSGRNFQSFLKLPWNLMFQPQLFHSETSQPVAKIVLFSLPLVILQSRKDKILRGLLLLVAAYMLFWFSSAQIARYLMPVVPLLCILAAVSMEGFLKIIPLLKQLIERRVVIFFLAALFILPGWQYARKEIKQKGFPPFNEATREKYLAQHLPTYEAYKFLNSMAGDKYRLYALLDENMAYYADGQFMGDWFGPARYNKFLNELESEEALYRELNALGVEYFLVNTGRLVHDVKNTWMSQDKWLSWRHLYPVFAHSQVLLFRVSGPSMCIEEGPDILKNPGFEKIHESQIEEWTTVGSPVLDSSGKVAAEGLTGIRSNKDNYVTQRVAVQSGLYLLSHKTRSKGEQNKARLQINWLDKSAQLLKADITVIDTYDAWMKHAMIISAPGGSFLADIYASVHEDSEVWFDSFSFKQIQHDICATNK